MTVSFNSAPSHRLGLAVIVAALFLVPTAAPRDAAGFSSKQSGWPIVSTQPKIVRPNQEATVIVRGYARSTSLWVRLAGATDSENVPAGWTPLRRSGAVWIRPSVATQVARRLPDPVADPAGRSDHPVSALASACPADRNALPPLLLNPTGGRPLVGANRPSRNGRRRQTLATRQLGSPRPAPPATVRLSLTAREAIQRSATG